MDREEPRTAQPLDPDRTEDQSALAAWIECNLPWLHELVRSRLGPALRAKAETGDFVQETILRLLGGRQTGIADGDRFRGLVVRIVENVLRDGHDRLHAAKRCIKRERPLPSDSSLPGGTGVPRIRAE